VGLARRSACWRRRLPPPWGRPSRQAGVLGTRVRRGARAGRAGREVGSSGGSAHSRTGRGCVCGRGHDRGIQPERGRAAGLPLPGGGLGRRAGLLGASVQSGRARASRAARLPPFSAPTPREPASPNDPTARHLGSGEGVHGPADWPGGPPSCLDPTAITIGKRGEAAGKWLAALTSRHDAVHVFASPLVGTTLLLRATPHGMAAGFGHHKDRVPRRLAREGAGPRSA
jgi:hypothetical protein